MDQGGGATASSRSQFTPTPSWNFIFYENCVITKICLYNSSIQEISQFSLVYPCLYGTLWLIFLFTLSFSLDLEKLAPTLPSPRILTKLQHWWLRSNEKPGSQLSAFSYSIILFFMFLVIFLEIEKWVNIYIVPNCFIFCLRINQF